MLTIELEIPIKSEPIIGASALTFTHWMPIGRENGIRSSDDGIEVLLWFNGADWWGPPHDAGAIKVQKNVLVHQIRARVLVREIDAELAQFMVADNRQSQNASELEVRNRYEDLGRKILSVVYGRANRLINYARAKKGQYWLVPFQTEAQALQSLYTRYGARAYFDEGAPFRFQPARSDRITISLTSAERYIGEAEWPAVQSFVASESRIPLALELLASAEQLMGNGYSRSALTEGVTALEVAVATFATAEKDNYLLLGKFGGRYGTERLDKLVEHLGLTATVSFLLPILFSETELSESVLSGCREAIAVRQNVVHSGQRKVKGIDRLLSAISLCCRFLIERHYEAKSTPGETW